MIRTTLLLAAAAVLIPTAARAQTPQDPCSLLTPDQIKAVLNSPVEPGQPGVAKVAQSSGAPIHRGPRSALRA